MAYNGNNLSAMTTFTVSGSWQMWVYRSADPAATVIAAGYISDAPDRGLAVQDTVLVIDTVTPTSNWYRVSAINAAGGATLVAFP